MGSVRLLRPSEAAERLGLSVATLATWRSRSRRGGLLGPRWLALGMPGRQSVRYPEGAIAEYVAECEANALASPSGLPRSA
jgi:predicted DNA-binding transcriptional regulator AlpA